MAVQPLRGPVAAGWDLFLGSLRLIGPFPLTPAPATAVLDRPATGDDLPREALLPSNALRSARRFPESPACPCPRQAGRWQASQWPTRRSLMLLRQTIQWRPRLQLRLRT